MTVHLATFSDESMSRSRELCAQSAMKHGVDSVSEWTRERIEASNYADDENGRTLELMDKSERGGGGWWCWKPYVLHDMMCQIGDGYLVYADAGIEFITPVSHVIDHMDQDIFLFGNNWTHGHWCKGDIIKAVWPSGCTTAECKICEVKQCQASVIFFRVSDYSKQFVAEWLKWCLFEGGRLIDDSPSRAPNHPEFRENRHDQAILTTLAYREGLTLHWWPSVYNRGGSPEFVYEKLPEYAGDDYPVLFSHHRRRNHEWSNAA